MAAIMRARTALFIRHVVKAWSRNWDAIIDEVVALESHGVKEIVLTGIDLGSYRFGKRRLSDLLEELLTKTSKVRFRISLNRALLY